jgi:alanine dehydrogenase
VLILSRKDLEQLLKMEDVIETVEAAFHELVDGHATIPSRTVLNLDDVGGVMLFMPSYLDRTGALAVKVVGAYRDNPVRYSLPTTMAMVALIDHKTGGTLSIMEGGFITAMRTGAASGIAVQYLARRDANVLGIFGAGVQAETQLLAMLEVRRIEEVWVYDILPARAKAFINHASKRVQCRVAEAQSIDEILLKSDIIVAATTSKTPIFNGSHLKQGTHVCSVGWVGLEGRELDSLTVKRSRLVVDSREGVLAESGDIVIPIREGAITENHIWCELKDLVSGQKEGRVSDEEITLWKSVGLAIEDAATALLAYRKAKDLGLGIEVEL